jgi:transposase-like protein
MKKQERLIRQEEMLSLIEKWQESGKTQQSFCQEHGMTFSTFYYWLKRYRRGINESSFLPVEINQSLNTNIEIRYPDGVILQLPLSVKLSVLKQLLTL